ncbi:MAG: DNA alkylation repair protein [Anaerolineales bacterium]|nr:DNA alkylation repair protein [Anaerolineales bacterium]
MPAISPARLKLQSARLAQDYAQPDLFTRSLRDLLERYVDRTHRPGQSSVINSLLDSYNVPPPVLRQVFFDLKPLVNADPAKAIPLALALWEYPILEYRLVAASLLGELPLQYAPMVFNHISIWVSSEIEDRLVTTILEKGFTRLYLEDSSQLISLIEPWLRSTKPLEQRLGLRTLQIILAESTFEDLPSIFQAIAPMLREISPVSRPDLLTLVEMLIRRSPQETVFALKQALTSSKKEQAAWLARQVINLFPRDIQQHLREEMK